MVSFISGLIKITTPILVILNFFSGIIGGGWLLFTGEWKFALLTFVISLFIPLIYSIVAIPFNLLIGAVIVFFTDRQKKIPVIIFGVISILISNIIELIWVFVVFFYMVLRSDVSGISIIPYLFYGYSLATGPFTYMASKEPEDSIGTYIGVYFIEISYAILAVLLLLDSLAFALPIIIVITVLLLVFLLKVSYETMDIEWIGTISKKKEIQLCITELNKMSQELSASSIEIVRPRIFEYLKDTEKVLNSLQQDKISPRNLILLLITNAIADGLLTGYYHIYRGVLRAEGESLLALYDHAVNELVKYGYYSPEEAEDDKAWIREQISDVG